MRTFNLRRLRYAAAFGASLFGTLLLGGVATPARAADLALSEIPLYLSTGTDPNIMLLIDDATSMDFQMAGDVSLLNTSGTTAAYPEIDQGEPIGLQCNFSLAAILAALLTLDLNGVTAQIQNLVQCIAGSRVENSNGVLQAPEAVVGGVCAATQTAYTNALNNQIAAQTAQQNCVGTVQCTAAAATLLTASTLVTTNQALMQTCLIASLLNNTLTLNVLNPPQFHYAYLNDTDDNYFRDAATDYTNGFLPVMLEESVIDPGSAKSIAEANGTSNLNYRPPLLSKYVCAPGVLGNTNCNSGVLPTFKYADGTYAPTRTNHPAPPLSTGAALPAGASADTRNQCRYPDYTFKGSSTSYATAAAAEAAGIRSPGYWRAWNSVYNPIAYDPKVRYRPWKGYDSAGNAYIDATATAARLDPLNPTSTYDITIPQRHRGAIVYRCGENVLANLQAGGTVLNGATNGVNIKQLVTAPVPPPPAAQPAAPTYAGAFPPTTIAATNTYNAFVDLHNAYGLTYLQLYPARYYDWTDVNGNGRVDSWESHNLVEIRTSGCGFGATCPGSFSRPSATYPERTDCPSGTCTVTQELQNYANWFQYYRRRELVAKAALSEVVSNKQAARMGLAVTVKNRNTKTGANSTGGVDVIGTTLVQRKAEPLNQDYTTPASTYYANPIVNSKRNLLDHIQSINSGGNCTVTGTDNGICSATLIPFGLGKPLRSALVDVGEYYACNNANPFGFNHTETGTLATFDSSCPQLSRVNGGACQRDYTVMVTDGFWGGDVVGVGNADGNNGGAYADSNANTLADVAMYYYENDLSPGAGGLPNSMATITGVDEATHQHMVTYTLAFGVNGRITNIRPTTNNNGKGYPAQPTVAFDWGNPANSDEEKIDDMRHAAYNSRGKFHVARDTKTLVEALNLIFQDAGQDSSAASVALNSGALNTGTQVYQARFNSGTWTGQLQSFPVSTGPGTRPGECGNEPLGQLCPMAWDAAQTLNTLIASNGWSTNRVILTFRDDTRVGTAFQWNSLSTAQKNKIGRDLTTVDATLASVVNPVEPAVATASVRLNYLRGDTANERAPDAAVLNPDFRPRQAIVSGVTFNTVLGDIINSDPIFVGMPRFPYTNQPGYSLFQQQQQSNNRPPMVYVGANDGMLHGFRATDGRELLAFVPGDLRLYEKLPLLTLHNYGKAVPHRFFVDGAPNVGDVQVANDGLASDWRTMLVGGLRKGGQAIFALDVTDPTNFTEANAASIVKWQFSDADDPDMGYSFSRPQIERMANGKWAAIFGNGYNSTEVDGAASTDASTGGKAGEACLFIVYMSGPTGTGNTWVKDTDYKKICVNSEQTGDPLNSARPNGMATPYVVGTNRDFNADLVYAGDLEGNLWKFDVSSATMNDWGVAHSGQPLFRACSADPCTSANRQPITMRPTAGPTSIGGNLLTKGILVYFGTGKYIETGDDSQIGQLNQTFYMVHDQLWGPKVVGSTTVATDTPTSAPTLPITRTGLQQQRITREVDVTGANCTTDDACYRLTTNNAVNLDAASTNPPHRGWYIDLLNTAAGNTNNHGERAVTDPLLRDDRVVFTTLIPSVNQCEFGGTGWLMELAFGSGSPTTQAPFDVNGDGTVDTSDVVDGEIPSGILSDNGIIAKPTVLSVSDEDLGEQESSCEIKYTTNSAGEVEVLYESCGQRQGRVSWRQIR